MTNSMKLLQPFRAEEVFIFYLQYGNQQFDEKRRILLDTISKIFPNIKKNYVYIENKFTNNLEIFSDNTLCLINGDNTNREFSGWDRGLQWTERKFSHQLPSSALVFVNDTFCTHFGIDYLEKFDSKKVESALRSHGIIGHIDHYPEEVSIEDLVFKKWIRTNFFITTYQTIKTLSPLVAPFEYSKIFSEDLNFFNQSNILSNNYKSFLAQWLFSFNNENSSFNEEWYKKEALNNSNRKDLQEKARCIISEHYLSARAQKLGIELYSI